MRTYITLAVLLAAGIAARAGGGSEFGRRYSKEELEALEKEWEDGDEEEDLLTEGQIKYRQIEARRNQARNIALFMPPGQSTRVERRKCVRVRVWGGGSVC